MIKILVPDVEGWAIVRWRGDTDVRPEGYIYAEHIAGCNVEFDGELANWCWEATDASPEREDECWHCDKPVPGAVVALVAMMNWKEL